MREAAGRRLIREGCQERDISVATYHRSRKLAHKTTQNIVSICHLNGRQLNVLEGG